VRLFAFIKFAITRSAFCVFEIALFLIIFTIGHPKIYIMKIKLLLAVFLLCITFGKAQNWQWAVKAGGIKSDKANDIDLDADGNAYISGYYNTTTNVYFGSNTPVTDFGKEGFIAKVDKAGNWIWVKSAIGGWDERVLGMCVDKVNGFVYATGTTWGWGPNNNLITFGTCTNNPIWGGNDQIFVGKFDLLGNCQWLIGAGGESDDHGYDLVTDKQGNIYLTGFISDAYSYLTPAAFGTFSVYAPPGDSLGFVVKISPAGIFQWVQTFGGTDGERDNRIAIDSSSNLYITGGFHGTKAFGSTTLTSINAGLDVFVVKYDKNGNFIWAKQAGGILDDRANGITVDPQQKIYITGEFRDYAYFGTDTVNNNGGPGGRDVFVAKMNTAGNWQWVKKAGSKDGGERGNGICSNKKGNIFVTGQFADTAKFGPVLTLISAPTTTIDVFVAAIDSLGKWQWAMKAGGSFEDRGNGIACDDSCNLYTAGYFESAASFGSNTLFGYGNKDIFVARLNNTCFNYTLEFEELQAARMSAVLFPNPAADFINLKVNDNTFIAGRATVVFTDVLGRIINITHSTDNNNLVFDISSLSPGVYSLNLVCESKSTVIKFVKQ